jgi:hypothetical protein
MGLMRRPPVGVHGAWLALLGAGHLVLLLSLLPSVLYIDHWVEFINPSAEISKAGLALHESHCHLGSGSCGEQPAPTNLKSLSSIVDLPQPQLLAVAIEDVAPASQETFITPPTEPPRG